jgi:hypothetical protein
LTCLYACARAEGQQHAPRALRQVTPESSALLQLCEPHLLRRHVGPQHSTLLRAYNTLRLATAHATHVLVLYARYQQDQVKVCYVAVGMVSVVSGACRRAAYDADLNALQTKGPACASGL